MVIDAPSIIGVVQQASADQLKCDVQEVNGIQAGRVVAVLFSEEITLESAQDRVRAEEITNYLPQANRVVGVALQVSPADSCADTATDSAVWALLLSRVNDVEAP